MPSEDHREAGLRRQRVALSCAAIGFGVLMLAATVTSFGPSPLVGVAFGVSFIIYGGVRLYRALRS
ncbi:MAG: hypothetical protein WA990_05840 [Rubrobacteraceae bacterium]